MPTPNEDKRKQKGKRLRLTEVDVSHVSLVDRPANRRKFALIKRDQSKGGSPAMHVHLKNLFGTPKASVTSVIAKTEEQVRALAPLLMDGDEATISEIDGLFVARKSDTEPGDHETVIHSGAKNGIAYTVAHMEKGLALYDMDSTDFDETLQKNGFAPGIHIGVDALVQTIFNAAMSDDANSPDAFKGMVTKAVSDFSGYVETLIDRLPVTAFKFEKAALAKALLEVRSPNKIGDGVPGGFTEEAYNTIFGTPEDAAAATETAEPVTEGETPAESETPVQEATQEAQATPETPTEPVAEAAPAEATPAPAADAAPANMEELPASTPAGPTSEDMERAVQEAMASLTKSIGESIAAALAPLNDRLEKQDAAVSKLAKAVGGSVLSEPEADQNVISLRKGDEAAPTGGEPPLLDTGYSKARQG